MRPLAAFGRRPSDRPQPVRVSGRAGRFGVIDIGTVLVWEYGRDSYAAVYLLHEGRKNPVPDSFAPTAVRDRRVELPIARRTAGPPIRP